MLREQALKLTRSKLTIAKQILALSETEVEEIEKQADVLPGTFASMLADPEKAKLLDFLHFRLLSQIVLPEDEEAQTDLASPGLMMAGQDLDDQRIPFADDVEHRRDAFQRNVPYQKDWDPSLWPVVMETLGMDIDDVFRLATRHHPIGIGDLLKMFELYAQRCGEKHR